MIRTLNPTAFQNPGTHQNAIERQGTGIGFINSVPVPSIGTELRNHVPTGTEFAGTELIKTEQPCLPLLTRTRIAVHGSTAGCRSLACRWERTPSAKTARPGCTHAIHRRDA